MGRSRGRGGGGGGGQGVRTPQKNHNKIAIPARIPGKITKLPSQHSMLGHYLPASETPFQCCFAGGQMMAQLKRYWILCSPHQLQKNKKTLIKFGPPLTKLSRSANKQTTFAEQIRVRGYSVLSFYPFLPFTTIVVCLLFF